jgi:type IV pilus assembly protein PilB
MSEDAEGSARRLAELHGLRFVDLTQSALVPGAASLLPEEVARRHHAVPIGRRLGTPVIAVSDPGDLFAMDALRSSVGREYVAVVARPDQVERAIRMLYAPDEVDDLGAGGEGDWPGGAPGSLAPADGGSVGTGFLPAEDVPGFRANGNGHGPGAGANGAGHGEPASPTGTLEESLRDVLAPPPVDEPYVPSAPPVPAAPAGDPDGSGARQPEAAAAEAEAPAAEGPDAGPGATAIGSSASGDAEPPPLPSGYGLVREPGTGDTGPSADEQPASGIGETAEAGPSPPTIAGPPLARVLVESGKVTPEQMAVALQAHQQAGESLARYLYNNHLATEDDLVEAMAAEVGLEFVDLNNCVIDTAAVTLIPEATARHHMVLPIGFEDGVPLVAMANPTDVFAMDDLRTIMGRNFTPVVATRSQIAAHLRLAHESEVDVAGVAEDAAGGMATEAVGSNYEIERLQSVVEDAPIVRYVNLLILQALNERASDIHIEPTPKRLRIRFRIDGVMHDATSASPAIHSAVVSRLKVLGEMDIAEHRTPQEGRVSLSVSDRQIDLRLATLPSLFGETCVMRLLDKSASIRSLPELGFYGDTLERYSHAYLHPYGVILVTGPTGAGKTTTVYATLQEVMSPEKSVITVEDPVEYQIDGITQVQINQKAGLDFARALRSILRSDPDIVLIGEIRDIATATIAMEAALSGHLVLTTLHTNTASATPLRLTEMGIEPYLVMSSVTGVLTQRLARVLCPQCKEPYEATEKEFLAAGYKEADLEGVDISTLHRAVGCRACSHTGYHGRMVLAEILEMSEAISRMILEQQPISNIERTACAEGMRTLRMDGLLKAVEGKTTLQEVLRVVI